MIEQTTISLDVFEEKDFKRTANKIIEAGYKNYLRDKDTNDDEFKKDDITSLIEGQYKSEIISTNIEEKETTPPKYYTQGEIIKDMSSISKYVNDEEIKRILKEKDKNNKGANGSIGTPATQAGIIKSLLDRGFLEQKGKNVISTKLGRDLINILPLNITTPNLTALWWLKQEAIKSNEIHIEEFLNDVLNDIKTIISQKYEKITVENPKENQLEDLSNELNKEIEKTEEITLIISELEKQIDKINIVIKSNKENIDSTLANINEKNNANIQILNKKIKYAYILAGGAFGFSLIDIILSILKVI